MKAIIINIGDEILIGQIVNTNSSWMAEKMTLSGFEVVEMLTVSDDAQQIKESVDYAFKRADIVLMTGGLGPTKDDITKKTLCEYFDTELIFDESVLENVKQVISNSFTLNNLTHDQAYVPKDCTVIQNRVGTAPITWFDYKGKVLVSMPGVPYEMKYVMEHEIINRLQRQFEMEAYLKKIFIVVGYGESALAIHLTEFEENLPKGFGLAYLPTPGLVKLRLFVQGEQRKSEIEEQANKLRSLLGKAIISEEDIPMEKILGNKLKENRLTVSTAESCTGGRIAHLLTSFAGSSVYFKGSVVSYANEAKQDVLQVSEADLKNHGAVSEPVVWAMAENVKTLLKTDCSIAVSGIAGPDGGSEEKPVGTVWIATSYKDKTEAQKYQLGKYREANIIRASNIAMLQLLKMIDNA